MDTFITVLTNYGVAGIMLAYFIWNTNKQQENFKETRISFENSQKEMAIKFADLTEKVTAVMVDVNRSVEELSSTVEKLNGEMRVISMLINNDFKK